MSEPQIKAKGEYVEDGDSQIVEMSKGQLDALINEAVEATREKTEKMVFDAHQAKAGDVANDIFTAMSKNAAAKEQAKSGSSLGRTLKCLALSAKKYNNLEYAENIAKEQGHEDVAKRLSISNQANGGALVLEDLATDVIDGLRPKSVLREMGVPTIPLPNGNMNIARFDASVAGRYEQENGIILSEKPNTDRVTLNSKRAQILVPISKDLLMTDHINVEMAIGRDVNNAAGALENSAFIRGDGVNPNVPTGVLNLGGNRTASVGTSDLQREEDFIGAVEALADRDVDISNLGAVFSVRAYFAMIRARSEGHTIFPELRQSGVSALSNIMGIMTKQTTSIPRNLGATGDLTEFGVFNIDDLIIGDFGGVEIEIYREGSYQDAAGVVHNPITSNEVVLSLTFRNDLATRHNESIQVVDQVAY